MAWSAPSTALTAQIKASGTTLSFASLSASVGEVIVIAVATDNLSATTPTVSSISGVPGGETNSWSSLSGDSPQATAAAGTRGTVLLIKASVAWSNVTLTINLSGAVTAKAAVLGKFPPGGAHSISQSEVTTGSVGVGDGLPANAGDIVFGVAWTEDNAPPGVNTVNQASTDIGGIATTGGGAATNAGVRLDYRIISATTASILDNFYSVSDGGSLVIVVPPTPSADQADNIGITDSVRTSLRSIADTITVDGPAPAWTHQGQTYSNVDLSDTVTTTISKAVSAADNEIGRAHV